jgi:hypothetical protein
MENIKAYEIEGKELSKILRRIGDLINLDGPMLSLFIDEKNQDLYLFDWVDSDSDFNRWLIYKVSLKNIQDFLEKKISYKKLFLNSVGEFYYTDIHKSKLLALNIRCISGIPDRYKPNSDTFFDETDSKNLKNINELISNLPVIERLNYDKENKYRLVNNISTAQNHYVGLSEINPFGGPQLVRALSLLISTVNENEYPFQSFHLKKLDPQNDFKSNRISKREKLGLHNR